MSKRQCRIKSPAMANQGGLMRTGYAMGTEHPVIPSEDGSQLDMRETVEVINLMELKRKTR